MSVHLNIKSKRDRNKLKIALDISGGLCLLKLAGGLDWEEDPQSIDWIFKTMTKDNSWHQTEIDCRELFTTKAEVNTLDSYFISLLFQFKESAESKRAVFKVLFKNQKQARILKAYGLYRFFEPFLAFEDPSEDKIFYSFSGNIVAAP